VGSNGNQGFKVVGKSTGVGGRPAGLWPGYAVGEGGGRGVLLGWDWLFEGSIGWVGW